MKVFLIMFFVVCLEFVLESYVAQRYYQSQSWWFRHIKLHHFSIFRYLVFFGIPFATIAVYVWLNFHPSYLIVYIVFALIGSLLEWLIGFAYHHVVGTPLWTYHKYTVNKYTSLLSIPIWGFSGILFWRLANLI